MIRFQCEKFFKPLHAPLCSFIESRGNKGLIEWDPDRETWETTGSGRDAMRFQAKADVEEEEETLGYQHEPKKSAKKRNNKKKKKRNRF